MRRYENTLPLSHRDQETPDTGIKPTIADLLDALQQARQDRDQAQGKIRRLESHIEWLNAQKARLEQTNHMLRKLVSLKKRRCRPKAHDRQPELWTTLS